MMEALMLHTLSVSLLPLLLICAAASDVMSLRIPNWLTALTAALFFPMALLTGMPLVDFAMHVAAGLGLFCAGFLFFQIGLFGGGDAKLMAAAGLWFGTAQTLPFLFMTAMAGGLLAMLVGLWSVIAISWEIQGDNAITESFGKRIRGLKPNVPYGFALAIGGIIAFKDTWWMHSLV
jgi:prepilin peptidase CpaA